MPGLYLGRSVGSGMGSSGVASAVPPSYAGSPAGATISARAYGVGSSSGSGGPCTAALGGSIAGLVGIAVLVYLWWSLPR